VPPSTDTRPLPNLRHLTAALEIDRLGSISRAADSVHLSQSAITQGLAKLEHTIGVELFTRSPTGLFVTPVGKLFLYRVQRAMDWLVHMDNMLGRRKRHSGHLARILSSTQLRAFMSVVECGSYTLAANQLELTQPTVHRAVREIEALCQQRFFQRSPAGVEPSWQARQLARYASLFFAELGQGLEEVREQQGLMEGSLRIGSLPLARTQLVPHAVIQLLRKYPDAHISIIDGPYDEQLHSLLHGQLDIIVGALRNPVPSPEIEQELLFHDALHIVVRPKHPLATRSAKNTRELHNLDWIAPRRNTPAREVFSRFFTSKGLTPPERLIECSSLAAIRSLLLESDRAALLPARQVELDVKMGLLAVSPQRLPGTSREIGLTLRKGWHPTRLQQHFLDLLRGWEKPEIS
jgi:LysR family transcriptional regulator, regulator for genes of the gallate degradation pathway